MNERDEKGHYLTGHSLAGPGRPSDYDPSMNEQARKLALLGLTDKEMAEYFGVSEKTLNTWKGKHPAFLHALMDGKVNADAEVAESLYKRATGEHVHIERAFKNKETGEVDIVKLKVWQPGDTGAAKMWLTNRRRENWSERIETATTGDIHVHIEPALQKVL